MIKDDWRTRNWFAEKAEQVNTGGSNGLVAFGVPVDSRYSQADEYVNMIQFMERCARKGIANYVTKVFCDSKVPIYVIDIADIVREGDPVERSLLWCAKQEFDEFMWPRGEQYRNNHACPDPDPDPEHGHGDKQIR